MANKVAEKISAKSSYTNLFQPSDAATSTLITLATPSTSGPIGFANQIHKDQEYDKFGIKFTVLFLIKYLIMLLVHSDSLNTESFTTFLCFLINFRIFCYKI